MRVIAYLYSFSNYGLRRSCNSINNGTLPQEIAERCDLIEKLVKANASFGNEYVVERGICESGDRNSERRNAELSATFNCSDVLHVPNAFIDTRFAACPLYCIWL
jgi:hypothetical protein